MKRTLLFLLFLLLGCGKDIQLPTVTWTPPSATQPSATNAPGSVTTPNTPSTPPAPPALTISLDSFRTVFPTTSDPSATFTFSFTTNEPATCEILYGAYTDRHTTAWESASTASHSITTLAYVPSYAGYCSSTLFVTCVPNYPAMNGEALLNNVEYFWICPP